MTKKPYKCAACGYEKQIETNHFGKCYSWGSYNRCPKCPPLQITVWLCVDALPPDAWVPEDWLIVKLGDIAEIK